MMGQIVVRILDHWATQDWCISLRFHTVILINIHLNNYLRLFICMHGFRYKIQQEYRYQIIVITLILYNQNISFDKMSGYCQKLASLQTLYLSPRFFKERLELTGDELQSNLVIIVYVVYYFNFTLYKEISMKKQLFEVKIFLIILIRYNFMILMTFQQILQCIMEISGISVYNKLFLDE